jgi:hypothetical protein
VEPSTDGTIDDLVADAVAAGHEVSRRLITDWVACGLLDRPQRRARGRGKGSHKGVFSANQRRLFLTLLDKRAQGARHKRALAQAPIFLWAVFGDEYVPTRQALLAMRTWVGDATANLERSRLLAREVLQLHDHPSASPADRRELEDVIASIAHSGRARDVDRLMRAVQRVFEPKEVFGTLHRAIGHPDVLLTVDTMVTIIEARQDAVRATRAGALDEEDLQRARRLYRASRSDYASRLPEYRASAPASHRSLFRADTPQSLFDSCANDVLTCLGLSLQDRREAPPV